MNALRNTTWEMDALQKEINNVFDTVVNGRWTFPFSRASFLPARGARLYPLLNISEDNENFYIEAMAPGVIPESLEVKVIDNQLQMSGEKAGVAKDVKYEAIHRSERGGGRFIRNVQMPTQVDPEKVTAQYKNGLLRVTVGKSERTKPRKILINVN